VRARRRAPAAVAVPVMLDRRGSRSTRQLADDERSHLATLLADTLLLEHLRHRGPLGQHLREVWTTPYSQLLDEDLMRSMERADGFIYGTEDGGLPEAGPMKRTTGHLRSPRELHPVYLGLGQDAASAALNTYASLLADEKRRENLEQQQQSSANPVRFIGKR